MPVCCVPILSIWLLLLLGILIARLSPQVGICRLLLVPKGQLIASAKIPLGLSRVCWDHDALSLSRLCMPDMHPRGVVYQWEPQPWPHVSLHHAFPWVPLRSNVDEVRSEVSWSWLCMCVWDVDLPPLMMTPFSTDSSLYILLLTSDPIGSAG